MSTITVVRCATLLGEIDLAAKRAAHLLAWARPKYHHEAAVYVANNGRMFVNLTDATDWSFEPELDAPLDLVKHRGVMLRSTQHHFFLSRRGMLLIQWLYDASYASPAIPLTADTIAVFCAPTELQAVLHELHELVAELEQAATIES